MKRSRAARRRWRVALGGTVRERFGTSFFGGVFCLFGRPIAVRRSTHAHPRGAGQARYGASSPWGLRVVFASAYEKAFIRR